ncbi:MAG: hypothetical protein AAGH19_03680 [Pseudomonadota bacterium]
MHDPVQERWEAQASSGFWRFILTKGMLRYGVLMFAATNLIVPLVVKDISYRLDAVSLLTSFAIWMTAGALFGAFLWRVQQKKPGPPQPTERASASEHIGAE